MLSGISTPQESAFTCPSGNCTWPPFDSLGLCSSCKNVTTDVRTACQVPDSDTPYIQTCNYTVGAAWTLSAEVAVKNLEGTQTIGTTINATTPKYPERAADGDTNNHSINVLQIGQDQYNAMSKHAKLEDLDVTSHECSFSFCRKTYAETTMVNGVLRETVSVQHPFSLDQTVNYTAPLAGCDMRPGEEVRMSTSRVFRVFSGQADSPYNATQVEELFSGCPDIKAISKDTGSYHTSIYETGLVV